MGVYHRSFYGGMSQEFLNGSDIGGGSNYMDSLSRELSSKSAG